jgi:hypothetical protein
MATVPDDLLGLIAALPRKQQLDLVLAVLSRISLSIEPSPAETVKGRAPAFSLPSRDQLRKGLASLPGPDAALVAALALVSERAEPDLQFDTTVLNEVIGDARTRPLNVQALNPLCVDHYLSAVPSTKTTKSFRFTPLGLEKAKLVARELWDDAGHP